MLLITALPPCEHSNDPRIWPFNSPARPVIFLAVRKGNGKLKGYMDTWLPPEPHNAFEFHQCSNKSFLAKWSSLELLVTFPSLLWSFLTLTLLKKTVASVCLSVSFFLQQALCCLLWCSHTVRCPCGVFGRTLLHGAYSVQCAPPPAKRLTVSTAFRADDGHSEHLVEEESARLFTFMLFSFFSVVRILLGRILKLRHYPLLIMLYHFPLTCV